MDHLFFCNKWFSLFGLQGFVEIWGLDKVFPGRSWGSDREECKRGVD
jgi:hypothetical protein